VRENQGQPFLLSLHFRAPHAAWLPVRDEDWAPYKDLDPEIPNPEFPNLSVNNIKKMTREYYASVASVDRNMGRLLDLLDELKLSDNTLVVFTSDHGYHTGHHGLWYKGNARWQVNPLPPQRWPNIPRLQRPNMFDQALRVPTAVRWPGVIKPGSVVEQTVSNLDWYPTLLAAADVKLPEDVTVHGRSILPLLKGEKIDWDNDFYAEYSMQHGAKTHMRMWRTPQWKLMIDFKNPGRKELYHLAKDPGETTNLIDSDAPEAQHMKKLLTMKIAQRMQDIGDDASASN
jgi:uncharacterized sulfatase